MRRPCQASATGCRGGLTWRDLQGPLPLWPPPLRRFAWRKGSLRLYKILSCEVPRTLLWSQSLRQSRRGRETAAAAAKLMPRLPSSFRSFRAKSIGQTWRPDLAPKDSRAKAVSKRPRGVHKDAGREARSLLFLDWHLQFSSCKSNVMFCLLVVD